MFSKGVILIFLILGISSSIAHAIPHQNRAPNPCTDSEPEKVNPVLASSPSTKNTTTDQSTVKGNPTGGKETGTDNGKGSNQNNGKTDTATTDNGGKTANPQKNGKTDTATTDNNSKTTNPQGNGKTNTAATDNGTNNNGTANTGDPQTSLCLDPSVINQGSKLNGLQPQQNATNGTSASLTSTNNFINFCAGKTITNGQQIKTGSCNPIIMGDIASATNIPSGKFQKPKNLDTVSANTEFTVTGKFINVVLGTFTNAETNYFAAPQTVNGQGKIIGHTHFVIEKVGTLTSTDLTDPTGFAFFKGIDTAADADGTVSTTVTGGLPAGAYRLSSISTAANHHPMLVGVAQHGSIEDAIYFTVADNGKGTGDNTGTGNNNNTTANNTGNNNNNTASGTTTTNTGAKGKGGKNGTGGATGTTNTTATNNNKSGDTASKSGNNGKKSGTLFAAEQSPAPSPSQSPSPKKFTLDYRKE